MTVCRLIPVRPSNGLATRRDVTVFEVEAFQQLVVAAVSFGRR